MVQLKWEMLSSGCYKNEKLKKKNVVCYLNSERYNIMVFLSVSAI
jgi:hypothetical protein